MFSASPLMMVEDRNI